MLALRRVVSSAIVAPRQPPSLKRTRPDRRIGELVPSYGVNGPPVSPSQTFYFHHTDPEFEEVLPEVDLSRYGPMDGPVKQAVPDRKEVPDNKKSATSTCSSPPSALAAQLNTSAQVTHATHEKACATQSATPLGAFKQHGTAEHSSVNKTLTSPPSLKDPPTSFNAPAHTSVPAIIITGPELLAQSVVNEVKTIAVGAPDIEDVYELSRPTSAPLPCLPPPSDTQGTQDTTLSSQPSDIFSQPNDFVHFTPPTQESQQLLMSQIDTLDSTDPLPASVIKAEASRPSSILTAPSATLGKRPRDMSDASNDPSRPKRMKLAD